MSTLQTLFLETLFLGQPVRSHVTHLQKSKSSESSDHEAGNGLLVNDTGSSTSVDRWCGRLGGSRTALSRGRIATTLSRRGVTAALLGRRIATRRRGVAALFGWWVARGAGTAGHDGDDSASHGVSLGDGHDDGGGT